MDNSQKNKKEKFSAMPSYIDDDNNTTNKGNGYGNSEKTHSWSADNAPSPSVDTVKKEGIINNSGQKVFPEQFDDETVILFLRRHKIFLFKSIFITGICLLAMIFLLILLLVKGISAVHSGWFWIGYSITLTILLFWGYKKYFDWKYDLYIVTNKRVVDSNRTFPFKKTVSEADLGRVQDTNFMINGFWQSVFHYGSITIETAGESSSNFEWFGMPHPAEAQRILRAAAEKHEGTQSL